MFWMFRLLKLRIIGAIVVIMIATGNSDAVMNTARVGLQAAQVAAQKAQSFQSTTASTNATTSNQSASRTTRTTRDARPAAAQPGTYGFTMFDSGSPVAWCTNSIDIAINDTFAPAGARADFEKALRMMSGLTGVTFNMVGTTNTVPTSNYHLTPGNPYAPVIAAWVDPAQTDLLGSTQSATTTVNPADNGDGLKYVTGALVFNVNHDALYQPGFGAGMTRGNLYLHELGHLFGLKHVDAADELMNPRIGTFSPNGFAVGDRLGLLKLRCN